jgi:alkanesulfonate monooxygenase SsuD/methylene tetrahydromethanopterin reductase-like flavin-dependent oxidoreductase (luciferase family)
VQTSRVQLGTLMTASTFRLPGPLAIAVATVHAMSGGRVELGIGAGWFEREHRSFGIPFPPTGERFDRLQEQLSVITGLWSTPAGERFSFTGQHYRIDECANFPDVGPHASAPASGTRPRIIIGGVGPRRTPALAARFADEFNTGLGLGEGIRERFATFRRMCAEFGRDPAAVRLSTTLPVCCGLTQEEAGRRAASLGQPGARLLSQGVVGTAAHVLCRLEQFAAAGVDTVYFHLYDVEDLDHVRLLGREVLPHAA